MLTVDQYEYIRITHRVYDKGIREMARETGHSRNTIRKVLKKEYVGYRSRQNQPYPSLGQYLATIDKWLVETKYAHCHFTVKGNQKTLFDDIVCHFNIANKIPDYEITEDTSHGRIETRKIWTTTGLNKYLLFPHIGQVFMVERTTIKKNTDKQSKEVAYGITSKNPEVASPKQVLKDNRGHWCIESHHYIIDWNFQEDLSRIRTGYGPENITRLRRFVISIIKSKKKKVSIARIMRTLSFNTRAVFDYLKMTRNSCGFTRVLELA